MRIRTAAGLLLVGGAGIYVAALNTQSQAAASLCENYSVGARVDNPESIDGTSFLKLMGPISDPARPYTQKLVFCASMTMCDVSCSLEITDNVLTDVTFRSL